jgi:hypothetical protein
MKMIGRSSGIANHSGKKTKFGHISLETQARVNLAIRYRGNVPGSNEYSCDGRAVRSSANWFFSILGVQ